MWVRLVFGVALAVFCVAAKGSSETSIEILSPTNGATFAEFSSPAFKVRITNGDGTLRLYEGPPNTNSPGGDWRPVVVHECPGNGRCGFAADEFSSGEVHVWTYGA